MAASVVIVVPPFAAIDYPMLGPSLLVSGCALRGVAAEVAYLNIDLAATIGVDLYRRVALSSIHRMLGEALFREWAFGAGSLDEARRGLLAACFKQDATVPTSEPGLAPITVDEAIAILDRLPDFLDGAAQRLAARGASIIGWSSVFQQNLASIALARRVKAVAPGVLTVFGGANASEPMGPAIADHCHTFDVVISGEADEVFPSVCRDFLDGRGRPPARIDCEPIMSLDEVAIPDFSDFFAQVGPIRSEGSPAADWLPFESSRGCWWGAKRHCTFCGLNGKEMGYRSKSGDRVIAELDSLSARHDIRTFHAVDNIMPIAFARDVLPRLARRSEPLQFFYEVKSNLRAADLDAFVRAGVSMIQPGIESFSTRVLELVDKGVTGTQNLWLLRECASRSIDVAWNLLVGVPGEPALDYEAMLRLFPAVEHLRAPMNCSRIIIDRYSPYHSTPGRYGIRRLEPLEAYSMLYPEDAELDRIAYHFRGDYSTEYLASPELRERFESAVAAWRDLAQQGRQPVLYGVALDGDRLFVEDTRACATQRYSVLNAAEIEALRRVARPTRPGAIGTQAAALPGLLARRFVVEHDGMLLGVVTDPAIGVALRRRPGEPRRDDELPSWSRVDEREPSDARAPLVLRSSVR